MVTGVAEQQLLVARSSAGHLERDRNGADSSTAICLWVRPRNNRYFTSIRVREERGERPDQDSLLLLQAGRDARRSRSPARQTAGGSVIQNLKLKSQKSKLENISSKF